MTAHEVVLYEPSPGGRLRCLVCPHLCAIEEGHEGVCKVRGVRRGQLVSLVYGRPATVVSDEIEKKPLYHFQPGTRALSLGTFGCNVLCVGCQNWQISHAGAGRGEADHLAYLAPGDVVEMARRHKLPGVVFTYNDPVVWVEYVRDVAEACRAAGLYTAFITAGYIMQQALDYVAPYLDAFKFDLKAPGDAGWAWLSKVKDSTPCLGAAVRAQEIHGCHVEVVSNIVPGMNDDDVSLRAMASWVRDALGPYTPWHVTRFLPDFQLSYLAATPIATLERAAAIAKREGLHFVYVGNVAGHSMRQTVCPSCGRTAIRRGDRGVEEIWVREGACAVCGGHLQVVQRPVENV